MYARDVPPGQLFYHGTRADLGAGDLIRPGFGSNFVDRHVLAFMPEGSQHAVPRRGGRLRAPPPT